MKVAFLDDAAAPRTARPGQLLAHYEDPTVGAVRCRDVGLHDGVPVDEGTRKDVGTLMWCRRLVAPQHMVTGAPRDVDCLKGVNMNEIGAGRRSAVL